MLKAFKKSFSTLVIPDANFLNQNVKKLVLAASQFKDDVHILALGQDITSLEKFYSSDYQNGQQVFISSHQDFDGKQQEANTYFLNKFLSKNPYKRVIMGTTFLGKEILPQLSINFNSQAVTDVLKIESENQFLRPIYAGNAIERVQYDGENLFLSIRFSNFESIQPNNKSNQIQILQCNEYLEGYEPKINFKENIIEKSERPDLTDAKIIFSGGRALKSKENFNLLYQLSDKIKNSAVGASRAAVDAGYVSNDLQIGQTGKIVAPDIYFAFGISGAIQHVAGIKDSKIIVAVNKNKEEPIFEIADYGLEEDIFKVIPELIQKM